MAFLCKYKPLKWQLTLQIGIKHWSGDRILTGPHSVQHAWREPRRRKEEEEGGIGGMKRVSKQTNPMGPCLLCLWQTYSLLPIKLWPLGMKSGKRDSERQTQAWDCGWWQGTGEIWKDGYFTQGGKDWPETQTSSVPVKRMSVHLFCSNTQLHLLENQSHTF